ncbi:MAG: ABC transporter substrate-binding protein, partial [Thermomicrobiales bacterium]|nr:ABC transporter substrate-binding protein [Thermomicrobiales bacterium]
ADSISGIETPDDRTLVVTLAEPNATFLLTLGNFTGFGILPEHVLGEIPPDQLVDQTFLEPSVSGGPFELVRYETDQFVELRRNESYGGSRPALDRILMPIRTPAVAMAELERGEIDIMRLQHPDLDAARQIEGVSVVSVQGAGRDAINVNHAREYLQDKRVRQAMMYAIDRQGIVDSILQGEGEVVNSDIFGPDWMLPIEGLNPYEFDPERARALLEEVGWNPDQKIQITITPPNEDAWGPIVHQQLRDVGFDAELLQVDVNEYLRQLQEEDFDLVLGGGGTFRADPNLSARSNTTANLPPAGSNWARYSNPEVDDLYVQGRQTPSLEERREIYLKLALILNEDMPNLLLWSKNSLHAVNNRVHGFEGAAYVDNVLWSAETWSVDCE